LKSVLSVGGAVFVSNRSACEGAWQTMHPDKQAYCTESETA